jgi:hypothetical protein
MTISGKPVGGGARELLYCRLEAMAFALSDLDRGLLKSKCSKEISRFSLFRVSVCLTFQA